jgi:hypothetical protein
VRVLVACEFSGIVSGAFRVLGHEAWSCDLLDTESATARAWGLHWQGDVLEYMSRQKRDFDLIIAHPPCTYLTNAGVRWLYNPDGTRNEDRWRLMEQGAEFFNEFKARAPRVCIENPIMHGHAMALCGPWSQTVQPWQFGDPEFKRVCLWLENLPPLVPSNTLVPPKPGTPEHKAWSKVHRASPGPNRAKDRSRFFLGLARAMADQWGKL